MIDLHTERLHIRNFTSIDVDALHTMILQYAASPYAKMDHKWPTEKDENGQPIEFPGYTFTLTKEEWLSMQPDRKNP
jgi:hypothetical protein